ncbi:MAG: oligosaccharide flippase family protein [Chloroflexi bacterium]|nr:oligosaccharide flippase family protein [Chloroflexota bacterium]
MRRCLPALTVTVILLFLLLVFFWPVTLGGRTLLPADNLFAWQPWRSFAGQLGVGTPHNGLLSDLILENYVWKKFIVDSLHSRQIPLWNPYLFAGVPFLAAGQHSALYPLSLIYYILPLAQAYGWFTVLQLLISGLLMYAYARAIGANYLGSLLAAIVYVFCGFTVVSVVFPMILAAVAWLPALLLVIEKIVVGYRNSNANLRQAIPWVIVGAVALCLQILAGHAEITYYVLIVTALYTLCRLVSLWWERRDPKLLISPAVGVATLFLLGIGLSALQFIPLYELGRANFRQGSVSYEQVVSWAYPMRRIIAFLIPDFFGNPSHHSYIDVFSGQTVTELRNYAGQSITTIEWGIKNYVEGASWVGLLPLLFALVAIVRHRNWYTLFFTALAVVSLLFVFGTPFYRLVFALPFIGQLHSPFRWVFPYTFSVAALGSIGATWLSEQWEKRKGYGGRLESALGWLTVLGGLALAAGLSISLRFPDRIIPLAEEVMLSLAKAPEAFADGRAFFSYEFRNLTLFAIFLVGSGAVFLASQKRWRIGPWPMWQVLALVVLVAELFTYGIGFNPRTDPRLLDFVPPVVEFLKSDPELYRITAFIAPGEKTFNANAGMLYGIADARGYDSMIPKQYVDFMSLIEEQGELLYNRVAPITEVSSLDSPLLDALNVKYILTTQEITNPNYTLVYDGEIRVYRNDDVLPRAFAIYNARVIPDEMQRAQILHTFDPRKFVVLEENPGTEYMAGSTRPWEPVNIERYGINEVMIQATLPVTGFVVLSDSYFASWPTFHTWKAYDLPAGARDEQELTIYRANGNFRAVALPPGAHTIHFKYTPFSAKLGLYVSFVSLVTLALLGGLWLWGRLYRQEAEGDTVRRVAKNALTPMVLSLINRVLDMVFAMLMLRVIAPQGAGRYEFAVNFILYASIVVQFGLGTLLTREAAKDRLRANRYLSNATILRLLLWLTSLPIMALVLFAYARTGKLAADTILAIAFFTLALVPDLFANALSSIFQAYERMEYPAAVTTITQLLKISFGTFALLMGWGFVGVAGTSLAVNMITAAILYVLARRLLFRPRLEFDPATTREMLGTSFPLMLNNLLSKAFFSADVFLLQPLRGDVELGYYSVAMRYIHSVDIIPSYFTLAVFPIMSRFAESARDSLVRAYILSIRLLLLVALPLAMGTTFVARELILILGGAAYMPHSMIALQILIWFMPIGFINSVTQYVLIAINQQRYLTRAFLIGLAFNVVANLLLIPRFGYRAAAAVTVLSEVALLIPFYLCVRKNLTPIPWLEVFWRPTLAAAVMGTVMWLLRDLHFLVIVPVAVMVYFVTLIPLGTFRDPDVATVLSALPLKRLRERFLLRGALHKV